jgi:signal transduction histidine kinase
VPATTTESSAPRTVRERTKTERPSVRLLCIGGLALLLLILTVTLALDPAISDRLSPSLVVWGVLAALGTLSTLYLGPGRPALSMDLPVLLACCFVVGPVPAALVAFLATFDMQELRGDVSLWRSLWNRTQTALSVLGAGFVFLSVAGSVATWPGSLLAAGAALAADAAINYFCVALVLSLATTTPIQRVIGSMRVGSIGGFAATYTGFGLTGLMMAEAYRGFGFAGVLVFVGPILIAREAFSQRLKAETAIRSSIAQGSALRRVDERIADERKDERARIAAALHDDVLQSLYNVMIRTQVIREDLRSGRLLELEEDVPQLVDAGEQAVDELRDVIRGLRRSSIGHAGLIDTLTLLVEHLYDQTGIRFVSDVDTSLRATPERELVVYQVAREALTNAAKHSSADTVWLKLANDGPDIRLEIIDNGSGFHPQQSQDDRHFGLQLMHERVAAVGGTLTLRSAPGSGTTLSASFPEN